MENRLEKELKYYSDEINKNVIKISKTFNLVKEFKIIDVCNGRKLILYDNDVKSDGYLIHNILLSMKNVENNISDNSFNKLLFMLNELAINIENYNLIIFLKSNKELLGE